MILLHPGCGKKKYPSLINLTKEEMDMSKTWPYNDESVDGIITMQVLQQLEWSGLVFALHEMHRVMRMGGVMRFGTMLVDDNSVDYVLGWKNRLVFSFDLLKRVLEGIGFKEIRLAKYQDSVIPEFKAVDDRPIGLGTSFIECRKI